MFIESYYLVYPEGELMEVPQPLRFNSLVDLNGEELGLPLQTHKMIVYRVWKITRNEGKGGIDHYYHLELVRGEELFGLTKKG
jgi:hypothetical protein